MKIPREEILNQLLSNIRRRIHKFCFLGVVKLYTKNFPPYIRFHISDFPIVSLTLGRKIYFYYDTNFKPIRIKYGKIYIKFEILISMH